MSSHRQDLAEAVKARRAELNLTHDEVSRAGGPSDTTMSKIENGAVETVARKTLDRLDTGLRWTPGTARAVWEDGTAASAAVPVRLTDYSSDDLLDELRRRLLGEGVRDHARPAATNHAGESPATVTHLARRPPSMPEDAAARKGQGKGRAQSERDRQDEESD